MTTGGTHPAKARLGSDPHRPAFHFTAPEGWLNDPNGLCHRDGVFHLFYQYNPAAPVHADICWGHATSPDLVHWTDEPVALTPSPGPDAEGCWSGVLVEDGDTPTLVYSGHAPSRRATESCCLAVGTRDLRSWTKVAANPVIAGPPAGPAVTEFRDHTVWREADRWHQAIGAGIAGRGGALFHYTSPDLRRWTPEGLLLAAGAVPEGGPYTGTTWECPDLFTAPGPERQHVLVFSAWDAGRTLYPVYLPGRLDERRFVPLAAPRLLDLGLRHFYAPQSFAAADGRRIQFGWIQEAAPEAATLDAGWSGVMSLPRTLAMTPDGTLAAAPVAEVEALRVGEPEHLERAGGTARARTEGDQLDVCAEVVLPPGGRVEVAVRATDDLQEASVVRLERTTDGRLVVTLDRSRSRRAADADRYDRCGLGGELPAPVDDRLRLRIIVDHSVLEIFAAGVPLTARVYPQSADATAVVVSASGEGARVVLDIWRLRAAPIAPGDHRG